MEWQWAFLLIVGIFVLFLVLGLPVAFSFLLVIIIGAYLFMGGEPGLRQLILSMKSSISTFTLLPVAAFILMGELMFHSGVTTYIMGALDNWVGRLPGRLALLAVAFGTAFAIVSGSSMASVAIMGSTLIPEMEKRGYKKEMSVGPVLGCGGLAVMIPPSVLVIVIGSIGEISIGKLIVAAIIPGFIMAIIYAIYIICRCKLQPTIAPVYDIPFIPLSKKLLDTVKHILPLFLIFFLVVGIVFLGVATPSEAAALGCLGVVIQIWAYRNLNWKTLKKAITSATSLVVMVFAIIVGAKAFSQILAFSGASPGLVDVFLSFPVPPIFIIWFMQLVLLILGCFMGPVEIMMLTLPIFMPIVHTLGFDPVWFGIVVLLNMEMACVTPPFGMSLFIMKGVAPQYEMKDIIISGLPFIAINLIIMVLFFVFPSIITWLPELML
jgi:tripartite ATP-independent transporter DctM subunit